MSLYKIVILPLMFLVIFSNVNAATLSSNMDTVIKRAIQEKRIVGTVVLVSRNGKIIYHGAYGWSDRENKVPMTEDTIFRLSSLTKPIVSVAVLKLVDEGKIQLDDPITKWIPEFKPKTRDGNTPVITIRNLLTHTAGLNYTFLESKNGPYHMAGISDGLDKVDFSLDENLKRLANVPLLFKPGTAWNYSLAHDVLGKILSCVEGKPIPEIITNLVLRPLSMTESGFVVRTNKQLATPYVDGKPEPKRMIDGQEVPFGNGAIVFSPARVLDKNAYPSGGAGMIGTAGDYIKFLESLRTGSISLSKESLAMLTSNQIGNLKIISGNGWGWTLGFSILKNPAEAKSPQGQGTYQWGGVYGHTWWVDPINRLSVVILTNTALEGMSGKFPRDVMEVVYRYNYKISLNKNKLRTHNEK